MSVLVAIADRDNSKLVAQLQARLPDIVIEQYSQCTDFSNVEFVLAWYAPKELWAKLPNLKVVSSFGAGVDSIDLDLLPAHVEVVRIVDTQLEIDMAEYVLTHVLAQKLQLNMFYQQQAARQWKPKRVLSHNRVAILGFGQLGRACAQKLIANGFNVSAWAQSHKDVTDVTMYYGEAGLNDMLPNSDYLVCLLPLTKHTTGIINKELLAKLPAHAVLINAARGQHVVEADLLHALDNDTLRAATLDAFDQEPLPSDHPYWQHAKITVTPHCAALSDVNCVIEQIEVSIQCLANGTALKNRVDRTKGY
jgi:glyoxylate/hydroxypyruvate reductase